MESYRTGRRPSKSRHRGAVLIEFAMCVIMLLFLLIGILEFGWMTRNKLMIANAAREGARVASLGRTRDQIYTRVKNAGALLRLKNEEISVGFSGDNGASFSASLPPDKTSTNPSQNGVPSGNMIRVSIGTTNKALIGTPLFGSRPIGAQVTMVREAS